MFVILCLSLPMSLNCLLLIDPSVLSKGWFHCPKLSQFDKIQVFLEIWQSSPYYIFYKIGIRVAHVFIFLCCFLIPFCCIFFFLSLLYALFPCWPMSLNWSYLIVPSSFPNVYLHNTNTYVLHMQNCILSKSLRQI